MSRYIQLTDDEIGYFPEIPKPQYKWQKRMKERPIYGCPVCGVEQYNRSTFCPNCGTYLQKGKGIMMPELQRCDGRGERMKLPEYFVFKTGHEKYGTEITIELIDNPDVVTVVRCKDCPLSKTDPNDYEDVYWCDFTPGRAHHSMDYCSEGARQKQMR